MKTGFLSVLFLAVLSCKKENTVSTNHQNKAEIITYQNGKSRPQASSQNREEIFNFQNELCDNKGYFDAGKYSKEQLQDTYTLWYKMSGSLLSTPSVFNLNSLQKVRAEKEAILSKLDHDFSDQKERLENFKLVNDPYWENVRVKKLRELNYEYAFRKTEIQAFSNPGVLLSPKFSKECENFAKALNSNDTQMVEEWRKLREEMSRKNSDPQRIMDEFEERLNSPEKEDFATIDLITFGWGNCVNDHIKRVDYDENIYKKFNALFIKIDSECDEP